MTAFPHYVSGLDIAPRSSLVFQLRPQIACHPTMIAWGPEHVFLDRVRVRTYRGDDVDLKLGEEIEPFVVDGVVVDALPHRFRLFLDSDLAMLPVIDLHFRNESDAPVTDGKFVILLEGLLR